MDTQIHLATDSFHTTPNAQGNSPFSRTIHSSGRVKSALLKPSKPTICSLSGLFLAIFWVISPMQLIADGLAQTNTDEMTAVKQAAQDSLTLFLPRAEAQKKSYGFEADDVVDSLSLKAPVELFIFDDQRVLTYQAGQQVQSLVKPTGRWFVPVAINGTNRAFIEVTRSPEYKWVGSGWGWTPLARGWQLVEKCRPASGEFTPLLIVSPLMAGYYFSIPQVQPANLTPMMGPRNVIAAQNGPPPVLGDANQAIQEMRQILTEKREKY